MPLRAPEILLKRTGLRIGYDLLRESHVLLLDAAYVVIEAKPLDEASNNEAITIQGRLAATPIYKRKLHEALVVFVPDSASRGPEERLEKLTELLSLASLTEGGEVREDAPGSQVIRRPQGLHLSIEPLHKYVEYTLSPSLRRRAESLRVEAYSPTLVNVLVDKVQIASIYYITPVVVRMEETAGQTRIILRPEESRATREN